MQNYNLLLNLVTCTRVENLELSVGTWTTSSLLIFELNRIIIVAGKLRGICCRCRFNFRRAQITRVHPLARGRSTLRHVQRCGLVRNFTHTDDVCLHIRFWLIIISSLSLQLSRLSLLTWDVTEFSSNVDLSKWGKGVSRGELLLRVN